MSKKFAFAGAGLLFLLSPLFVSAQSVGDLQAQIQTLLAQIQQLQTQIAHSQANGVIVPSTTTGSGMNSGTASAAGSAQPVCPVLDRTLTIGAQGDDVTQLQNYLAQQGVFTARMTGYFGALTEAAVQKWQAQNGIIASGDASSTGWGVVGPASRGWLLKWCRGSGSGGNGGGGISGGNFSASPTSGAAPLTVNFSSTVAGDVNFGDGSTGTMAPNPIPMYVCASADTNCKNPQQTYSTSHTYAQNGTYTATLTHGSGCSGSGICNGFEVWVVGTVTITVDGQTSNVNFTATPASGSAPLTVSFSARSVNAAGYTVDFGDGTSGTMQQLLGECVVGAGGPCNGGNDEMTSHTYTQNGTYTATLKQQTGTTGNSDIFQTLGAATITVTGTASNTSGMPVVSGVDGPASLAVGQQGTWTVHASVPSGGDQNLRYSVVWGDEAQNAFAAIQGLASATNIQTSASFTHTYASAGGYSPTFTVANSAGSARTSASVIVGSNATGGGNGGGGLICPLYAIACPAGQHAVTAANSCTQSCVADTTTTPPATFTATPTSGPAPLTVTFSGLFPNSQQQLSLNYGDGSAPVTPLPDCGDFPSYACNVTVQSTHTYTANGTYTATLTQQIGNTCVASSDRACPFFVGGQTIVGSVTITVGGPNSTIGVPVPGNLCNAGLCGTTTQGN
jgi:PKD repeat protein